MESLFFITLFLNFLYGGLLFSYFLNWRKYKPVNISNLEANKNWPSVTIVIPVRNEEKNLPILFSHLENLDYPSDKLEIIFVNDHSEDNTNSLLKNHKHFSLVEKFGKKAALEFGIRQSNSEWIVTIDADIHFDSKWLKQLIFPSINSDVQMICGLVHIDFDSRKWWTKFQSMEFANLQASGAGALMQKHVLLNSGANLAFRKEAWIKVGAYNSHQHLASGDDTFLMMEINKFFPGKIFPAIDAIVTTSPERNFADLLKQRLRWSGKTSHYKETYVLVVGVLVAISSITTAAILINLCLKVQINYFFAVLPLVLRVIPEWLLLNEFTNHCKVKFTLIDKFLMSLVYPFFIVLLIIIQPFSKNTWRGRKL